MTWIKLDTAIFRNKKMLALTDQQQLTYLRLLAWAGESSDDGHIPDHAMRAIPMTAKSAEAMADAGLLHRNGTGWVIHDWDDHQGSLLKRRAKDRQRLKEYRASKKEAAE